MSQNNNVVLGNSMKLLSIGRAWINDRDADDETKPRVTLKLDRDLGLNITLTPNSQILLFANKKREELNPATNQPYQDADYRVAVSIPAEIADAEIARQQALAESRRTAPVVAEPVAPVATPAPAVA